MRDDAAALYRLMSWLSPSFPVGAYAFSHGLEWQIEHEGLTRPEPVRDWIAELTTQGSGQSDLVLCAAAWRAMAEGAPVNDLSELALAFSGTAERVTEAQAQGTAFIGTVRATWSDASLASLPDDCAYPVAVGAVAAAHGVPERATLTGYAHAFVANLVSAAVRLVPLGQTDGQRITAQLEASVDAAVARAGVTALDDLASATLASDIAAMQHETQYTRLFRS
ncbi:MAG: urease accessory UreF family protein [Pseudomonadota bacterium]